MWMFTMSNWSGVAFAISQSLTPRWMPLRAMPCLRKRMTRTPLISSSESLERSMQTTVH